MKRLVSLSVAAILFAACSESTAPVSDLASRNAKPVDDPGITVSGNLTNDTFHFNDGSFTSSAGTTFIAEALNGGFGPSAPNVTPVYNNTSNHFLGRAENHRFVLVVPNGGSVFDLSYDLYIIGSWDGNGKQSGKQFGVDQWASVIACSSTGAAVRTLLLTTFSNQLTVQQSFPAAFGTNPSGNNAGEGAHAIDALGFRDDPSVNTPVFRSFGDTWYQLRFTGTNPCGAGNPMYFVWTVPDGDLQSNYDESWGLDNVVIKTD